MSVRLLSLHVVTGPTTCAPTRKAPTCAIVTTRAIAGLEIAVHARVSDMRIIKVTLISSITRTHPLTQKMFYLLG